MRLNPGPLLVRGINVFFSWFVLNRKLNSDFIVMKPVYILPSRHRMSRHMYRIVALHTDMYTTGSCDLTTGYARKMLLFWGWYTCS